MKDFKYGFLILWFLVLNQIVHAQKIDNLASFRDINSKHYFRFSYDNDFFNQADKNYTQGYNLELANPIFSKNPINYIFLKPKGFDLKHGLSIEHIGFTPRSIGSPDIQFGDRPFAAAIMFKSFLIATNSEKRIRISSSLNTGFIGPLAFGDEMQTAIHKAIDGVEPNGWRYQIANDAVVNYELGLEKQLLQLENYFALRANTNLRLGTLFTNASAGLNASIGLINNPFNLETEQRNFNAYIYAQSNIYGIVYDATMQGGLFNQSSVYNISNKDIERFPIQLNLGVVFRYHSLYLEYSRAELTKEFAQGAPAGWGGIKLGIIGNL